jgi:hypothetical protein
MQLDQAQGAWLIHLAVAHGFVRNPSLFLHRCYIEASHDKRALVKTLRLDTSDKCRSLCLSFVRSKPQKKDINCGTTAKETHMKKTIPIAALLLSMVLVSLPPSSKAQVRQLTIFLYAAKFICGKSGDERMVAPGQYFTVINVHNASPTKEVRYIKRFAQALPEERPGKISEVAGGILGPDQAMAIECQNIYKHMGMNPGTFIDGFALLYSLSELDVVSVHTAGHSEVETVNTERVPVRRFTIPLTNAMAQELMRK